MFGVVVVFFDCFKLCSIEIIFSIKIITKKLCEIQLTKVANTFPCMCSLYIFVTWYVQSVQPDCSIRSECISYPPPRR